MSQLKSRQLVAYGFLGMPLAMLSLPLYIYLPTFYARETSLSLSTIGFVLLLARLVDMLSDPVTGWLNDRVHPNWLGRRKLFILLGLPFVLVGVNALLNPNADISALQFFVWSVVTYLGWTLLNVPWQSFGAEISPDYHDKSLLATSREVFAIIGTVTVLSLPVILQSEDDLAKTMTALSNVLFFLLPAAVLVLLVLVKEQVIQTFNKQIGFLAGLKISHPAVSRLLLPYFINSVANSLPATLFILFVTHILVAEQQVGILLLSYFLAASFGLPFWYYLSRKVDKSRAWSLALIVSILSFCSVPFLSSGDTTWFLVICIASGFALGADVALPASIQADIAQQLVNRDEAKTGWLFGLWSLLTKLALALGVGLAFPLLEWSGFVETNPSSESLTVLVLLYAVLPLLLKIWVAWQMWRFPFMGAQMRSEPQ